MGKSKAPKAPDPLPAAQATAAANKEVAQYTTAVDRPTQIDPYGQTTWSLKPGANANAPKPGDWIQTTSLNPSQQNLLNKEVAGQGKAADMAINSLNTAQNAGVGSKLPLDGKTLPQLTDRGAPPSLSSIQPQAYKGANVALPQLANATALPNWQNLSGAVPTLGALSGNVPQLGNMSGNVPQWQQLDRIDTDPATFQQQGQEVRDALYNQLTRFSGQRYADEEAALQTQLANQGFAMGSEGYERELERLRRAKNETYEAAGLQSVLAGGQEQSRLFADQLAGQQSNIGLNQAQFGANLASRQQQEQELLNRFGAGLSSRQQQEAELLNRFGANLSTRQQQLGEQQAGFDAGTTRSQLDLANRLAAFDAGSTRYGMDQSERQAQFANQMSRDSFNRGSLQQMFQNNMTQNQWDLQHRQQAVEESLINRQTPLNEALALAGMNQIQGPNFQPFTPSTPWQPVDYLGVQNQQYQNNLNSANYNAAQRGQTLSTLGTLAGAGATAFA